MYSFPFFGDINISDLKDSYRANITLSEMSVRVDVNFSGVAIKPLLADTISAFLKNLEFYKQQTNKFIFQDFFLRDGETHPYITDMLDELEDDELLDMEDDPAKKADYEHNGFDDKSLYLLQKLKLVRIGLYPENNNHFAIFDYTFDIGGSPCNQLLVVRTDREGTSKEVDWES